RIFRTGSEAARYLAGRLRRVACLVERPLRRSDRREVRQVGRQFFRAAVRKNLIPRNPFEDVKAPGMANEARKFFINRETTAAVMDACPSAEWRLIFALSRFAGLRCPSEHLTLEWRDVDWERGRFLIRSPKTGDRWVPIFPELRRYLEEVFDL